MDAPQLPDAEASAESVGGGQPPGQVSAFRRALDSQIEASEPSKALVPTSPLDITAPMNLDVLRMLLASGKTAEPPVPGAAPASTADRAPVFPAPIELPIAKAPVPAPPPVSGPTALMPSVSAPVLHTPTTIAPHTNAGLPNATAPNAAAVANTTAMFASAPVTPPQAAVSVPTAPESDRGGHGNSDGPSGHEPSPRHNAKPSRLPTAVMLAVLLGACAGAALVLFNAGSSPDPLAPTTLPTMAVTHSPSHSPSPKPSPSPSPSPSASPSPSHASASPSHSPSPSPSRPTASPSPSAVASFATIYWSKTPDPRVADIQERLAKLIYLYVNQNGAYADTPRTTNQAGGHAHPDDVGVYQNATDAAVRAFEFDYIQHDQGAPPGQGCDAQTYQALVTATS